MTDTRTTASPQALRVERRTIEFIPESERHGGPRSLFFIWFAANMRITTAVTEALGVIAINVLNLYGAFMSTTTTVTALGPLSMRRGTRIGFVAGAAVVGTVIAVVGRSNFVPNYTNFILFLAYLLIPWTAINLVDFYFVRHQHFDIDAILDRNGVYGRVSWRAMTAYLLGVAVEIPFMSTTFYTGPMVAHLGGADIAWIIGLIVTSISYFVLGRSLPASPVHVTASANEQGVTP